MRVMNISYCVLVVTTSFMLSMTSASAMLPPPQQFLAAKGGALGKSAGTLVVSAYNSRETPRGAAERTGSEFDTQLYCHVVLDIFASRGAEGILSVRGIAVPIGTQPGAPEIDEVAPVNIDASSGDWDKIMLVPLRHNATFFDWEPRESSSGALYVWATALPCGIGIDGFSNVP